MELNMGYYHIIVTPDAINIFTMIITWVYINIKYRLWLYMDTKIYPNKRHHNLTKDWNI